MQLDRHQLVAAISFGTGCVLVGVSIMNKGQISFAVVVFAGGLLLMILAAVMSFGQNFKSLIFGVGKTKVEVELYEQHSAEVQTPHPESPRKLDEREFKEKESHAHEVLKTRLLPGQGAANYSALQPILAEDLLVRPSAYPMTPMYLLDNAFRILDWNEAFSVAFDRTMEGRKGQGILEWTYFLDNYEQVLDHGIKKFSEANALPPIDVEVIEYTSQRYGKFTATKRAYQIPDDAGACLGWLITLDMKFADPAQKAEFDQDLIRTLGLNLMWSEYALSYDRVLNNTKVYPELLERFTGGYDGVRQIPDDARILDLGAGTGNLACELIKGGRDRIIVAAENNRLMLELLRTKCKKYLRNDTQGGGIIALKQDVTSLYGLDDNYFDFVISNNVLYSIPDAEACLSEVCRVLKPGGELRLSGPRKDSNAQILFERIMKELKEVQKFDELEADYKRIVQINELRLRPWLYRWSTSDVEAMLVKAGFSKIVHSSEDIYAGQSMLICAAK